MVRGLLGLVLLLVAGAADARTPPRVDDRYHLAAGANLLFAEGGAFPVGSLSFAGNLTPRLALEADLDSLLFINFVTVGARYYFLESAHAPYATLGLGFFQAASFFDRDDSNFGFLGTAHGGVEFLWGHFALNVELGALFTTDVIGGSLRLLLGARF